MLASLRFSCVALGLSLLSGCARPPITDAASLMERSVGEDPSFPDPSVPGGVILRVPLSRLLCQPERYHGKRVLVSGYVTLEFEGNRICFASGSPECLWLAVEGVRDPGFRAAFASVEATFDGELRGHFGGYAGSLTHITRLERLAH